MRNIKNHWFFILNLTKILFFTKYCFFFFFWIINVKKQQNLYDPESRKKYDRSLKWGKNHNYKQYNYSKNTHNQNQTYKQTNTYSKSYELNNFSWIDQYVYEKIPHKNFYVFKTIFLKLDHDSKMLAYEYFWISFWKGKEFCQALLKSNNLKSWIEFFLENIYFEPWMIFLVENKILENLSSEFKKSITLLINEIKLNINKKIQIFNYIVDLINEDNVFDENLSAYLSLLNKRETLELFTLIESIWISHKNELDSSDSNSDGKISKKVHSIGGISFGTIGGVIFLVILFLYFTN